MQSRQSELGAIRRHYQGGAPICFKKLLRKQSDAMVSVLRRGPRPSRASPGCAASIMFELRSHRVTEHLAELVREHLIIRQGRQMIVCLDKIEGSTSVPAPNANYSYAKAG